MSDEFKNIPSKVHLEQFDVGSFAKDRIRDLFRTGKVPTAEAMVDEILLRAVKAGASDLHVEPTEAELRIRLGFEGVLKKLVSLPKDIGENLTNVLKNKGNLNAFEKKKSQEGRFSIAVGGVQFDVRINTLPIMNGERIALRFLRQHALALKLAELGFSQANLEKVRSLLHRPSGLFLVSGPASSGKSSTAYAILNDLNTTEKNIITVENPIEYRLDFASQVQASGDQATTIAEALRAMVKQNPNIVMIGEIRDAEAGTAAAEAALTGNLALSTMLSSDSIGAIFRLVNMGVQAYLLSSTILGVTYQQLVRRICPACKEEYHPTAEEHGQFANIVAGGSKFYRGKGCEKCEGTGYYGRTAVSEVLVVGDEIRDLIAQQASISKLKEAALTAGFENIYQDAMKKVTSGETTIAEFSRVIG